MNLKKGQLFRDKWIGNYQFFKQAMRLAGPTMLFSFLESIVSIIDIFYLSNYSRASQGGVVMANMVFFITFAMFSGIVFSLSVFTAQYYGGRRWHELRETVRVKILLSVGVALISMILSLTIAPEIIQLLSFENKDPNYISEGARYLEIFAFVLPIEAVLLSLISSLRDTNRPWLPLIAGSVAVIINLILDPIFIWNIGGFWPLVGVQGAAFATLLAKIVELVILIAIVVLVKSPINPGYRLWAIEWGFLLKMLKKVWPLMFNELVWSLAIILQQVFLWATSTTAVNAIGTAATVNDLFFTVIGGQATAVGVMVGNELGANNLELAYANSRRWFGLSVILGIGAGFLLFLSSLIITPLMNSSDDIGPTLIRQAQIINWVVAIILPVVAVSSNCFFAIRAGGLKIVFLMDSGYSIIVPTSILLILYLLQINNVIDWGENAVNYYYMLAQLAQIPRLVISVLIWKRRKWLTNLTSIKKEKLHN